MFRNLLTSLTVLLLISMAGAQQKPAAHAPAAKPAVSAASSGAPSEETVNAFMHEMFGYESQLSWKVTEIKPSAAQGLTEVSVTIQGPRGPQAAKFYITPDGKHALAGDLMPFGVHPFDSTAKILNQGANGVSRGPADAPVVIYEFSDLQCPHCKEEQPTLDKLLDEQKNVRLVLQSFPLPSHDWAAKAAAYADCIGRSNPDAFWTFIHSTYDAQTDITAANADEKLSALADKAGVKGSEIAACAAKPDTTSRIEHSIALGKSVDVTGTPTLFVNGRQVGAGVPLDILKQLVDFAAKK